MIGLPHRRGWLALVLVWSMAPAAGCATGAETGEDEVSASGVGGSSQAGAGGGSVATGGGSGKAGGSGKGGSSGAAGSSAAGGSSASGGAGGEGGEAGFAGAGGSACQEGEVCDNGADDNCDGHADEGCTCTPGAVSGCFRAPAAFRGKGVCKDGVMHCTGPGEFGLWTECEGDVLPGPEVCDPEGLDENCDGTVNEGCECQEGAPAVQCGLDVGECKKGTQACVGGKLGACEGSVDPQPEACDGKDNDCDGEVDEGLSRPCGESKGACSPGLQHCQNGQWGACEGAVLPADEICNGKDDDCDGEVDEGVLITCGTPTGACKIGQQICDGGVPGACVGAVGPAAEVCNGVDDDCDGQVDEGLDVACGSAVGACKPGVSKCKAGEYGPCEGAVGPADEACDGVDNNCNGTVDEGCGCAVGSPPVACGSDVGECKKGTQACVGGKLGPCVGGVGPEPETCNGKDDDCDGQIDQGVVSACGSSTGACKPGVSACDKGAWGACVGEVGPAEEICNGVDDDCDGQVDEGLARACGSDVGRCVSGVQTCVAGAWGACVGAVGPIAEVCEGTLDEDCDGVIDNGCGCAKGATIACGVSQGACKPGLQTCDASGAWGPCVGGTGPSPELCDGVDNNCDGQIDEGCSCLTGEVRLCGTNVGQCSFGLETCSPQGTWGPCVGAVGPSAEQCDGLDNDCNGKTDEGCLCVAGQTQPCGSSTGQCKPGKSTCTLAGSWGACSGAIEPAAEVCNGLDDDCDGQVDEGSVCPSPPPTVSCPGAAVTTVGTAAQLKAQAADPGGGPLSLSWSITGKPTGSSAQPQPPTQATTSLTPDLPGAYELTFCATNQKGVSSCCKTSVTAQSSCSPPPPAPAVTTCGTSWDRRPILEFPPLPSGTIYEIWQPGAQAPLATVTMPGQNYFRPASPIGPGAPPPGADASLYVKACKADSPGCCSTSNTVTAKLVESCAQVISPTPDNVLFSEYLINGSGGPCPGPSCQAGEAIEITNLSHCPVSLDGHHFGYQNSNASGYRWMDFTAADVIPPRGVYVAVRNLAASACPMPFFGPDDPSLFGLKISALDMQGEQLTSGWFNNTGGGKSTLRIATGAWAGIGSGSTIALISPYATQNPVCTSVGFNAIDACGEVVAGGVPTQQLSPNQLGRLWHPCDRVVNPVPASCH